MTKKDLVEKTRIVLTDFSKKDINFAVDVMLVLSQGGPAWEEIPK